MENSIQFHLINVQNERSVISHNDVVLEHLFENEQLHLGRYNLSKDSFFYTTASSTAQFVKTYTVLSGRLKELRTQKVLTTGDVFVIDSQVGTHAFYNLEDTILLCHDQSSRSLDNIVSSSNKMLAMLNELQEKDHYTREHCQRVFDYAKHMGMALNYHSMQIYHLNKAARFHDLGKIYIEDEILNKTTPLTNEEYEAMKQHTLHCKEAILEKYGSDVYKIISQHHERINGSGYPEGLKGDDICEEARIIAICDSFDAMTTDRVYKKGKSQAEAFQELRDLAETHYDKRLVELFIEINS